MMKVFATGQRMEISAYWPALLYWLERLTRVVLAPWTMVICPEPPAMIRQENPAPSPVAVVTVMADELVKYSTFPLSPDDSVRDVVASVMMHDESIRNLVFGRSVTSPDVTRPSVPA